MENHHVSWEHPLYMSILTIYVSRKHTVCYGKSPSFIGESTVNRPFSIAIITSLPEGKSIDVLFPLVD